MISSIFIKQLTVRFKLIISSVWIVNFQFILFSIVNQCTSKMGDVQHDHEDINQQEVSDGSDSDSEEVQRKSREWKTDRVIKNKADLNVFLIENNFWKKIRTHEVKRGTKTTYYCNVLGYLKNPDHCSAELCIFERKTTTNFLILRAGDHDHDENETCKEVSEYVNQKIKTFVNMGYTQRTISDKLRTSRKVLKKPTENQVFFFY